MGFCECSKEAEVDPRGLKANVSKMMPVIPLGPRQAVSWVPVA